LQYLKYNVSNSELYNWVHHIQFGGRFYAGPRAKFKEIYDQIENTIIKVDGRNLLF
jgi:hypothetical protein